MGSAERNASGPVTVLDASACVFKDCNLDRFRAEGKCGFYAMDNVFGRH